MRIWMLAADFGWTLLGGVLLLGGGGYWLDQQRGAETPWLTISGVLLGIAVAFSSLFQRLARAEREERLAAQSKRTPRNDN